MDKHRPTAYEPYRHAGGDEYSAEKPLVASSSEPQSRGISSSPKHGNGNGNGRHRKSGGALEHMRTALRALILALAISIVGIQAHAVSVYFSTRDEEVETGPQSQFRMMQWAVLNLRPTWLALAVAAAAAVVQFIALLSICTWLNKIRDGRLHVFSVYLSSTVFMAAWIASVVFFRVSSSQGSKRNTWDLWSYTCYNKSRTGNVPWSGLCIEMEYTWIASVVAAVAEILNYVFFVITQRRGHGSYKKVSKGKTPVWKK